MLVFTRKNRESVVVGRSEDLGIVLEITVLGIDRGRVRLGFQCDQATPIHRREVWEKICSMNGNGHANGNGHTNGHTNGNGNGHTVAVPVRMAASRGGQA
jgi:carbon storage regulator CsrA